MEQSVHSQLLTLKSAAEILGIQYRQLLNDVNSKKIPHYQIGKGRRLVDPSEIRTLIKHQHIGD